MMYCDLEFRPSHTWPQTSLLFFGDTGDSFAYVPNWVSFIPTSFMYVTCRYKTQISIQHGFNLQGAVNSFRIARFEKITMNVLLGF